jgi:hypothetical protein
MQDSASENEPGEEYFSHIHDGYQRRITKTLCGRKYHKDSNSVGTHIYSACHEDVCSRCRDVFDNDYVVTRRSR